MDPVELVFCVDRGALVGLHVTLASVCGHIHPGRIVNVNLLHEGLCDADLKGLESTIQLNGRSNSFTLSPLAIETSRFRRLRNHVGHGWMTYMRILAPNILGKKRLLYLDTDLIVGADIGELWDTNIGEAALGAVSWCGREESNDARFFQKQCLSLSPPYFNAGVLLLNAHIWRERQLADEVLRLGEDLQRNLPSADQTLLNIMFGESFFSIPRRYNTPVSPNRPRLSREQLENRVIHLVARPKPWDPFGWANGQAVYFDEIIQQTSLAGFKRPGPSLKTCRSVRAYAKCLKNLILNR